MSEAQEDEESAARSDAEAPAAGGSDSGDVGPDDEHAGTAAVLDDIEQALDEVATTLARMT